MKKLLPLCMFLLIYAPKIGGKIDSLSIVAILLFSLALNKKTIISLPKRITKPTILYLLFGSFMFIYSINLFVIYNLSDIYQILRFGRIIVNVLGVFGLVVFYYGYYKDLYGKMLLYHLWLCIIAHAFLMLLMFVLPSVNHFVITQLVQIDEANRSFDTRILGQRIGGLTGSFDATSGIQALGLLLLPFVFKNFATTKKRSILLYLTIPITLFSIGISGVTGFVVIFVVGGLVIIPRLMKIKDLLKYLMITLAIVGTVGVVLNYLSSNHPELVKDTSLGRTIYMITQDKDNYSKSKRLTTANGTIEKIFSDMYFLPDNEMYFLFGRGGSARSKDYVIKADPGIILNFHNLGVFFVLVLYPFCITVIIKSIKLNKQNLYLGISISAILLTILIIDSKVMYLLARNSLSIMLIAYFSLYSIKIKKNISR